MRIATMQPYFGNKAITQKALPTHTADGDNIGPYKAHTVTPDGDVLAIRSNGNPELIVDGVQDWTTEPTDSTDF